MSVSSLALQLFSFSGTVTAAMHVPESPSKPSRPSLGGMFNFRPQRQSAELQQGRPRLENQYGTQGQSAKFKPSQPRLGNQFETQSQFADLKPIQHRLGRPSLGNQFGTKQMTTFLPESINAEHIGIAKAVKNDPTPPVDGVSEESDYAPESEADSISPDTQSISHLNEFYEVFVKRFVELRNHYNKEGIDVKISCIFLDWDETTHTDLEMYMQNPKEKKNLDEASSKLLTTLMTERIVETQVETETGGYVDVKTVVMPFPVVVTANFLFLWYMKMYVLEAGKTNNLVVGNVNESQTLFEMEYNESENAYQISERDSDKLINNFDPKYSPWDCWDEQNNKTNSYSLSYDEQRSHLTMHTLIEHLIEDGFIEKADKDRIRAYAVDDDDDDAVVFYNRPFNTWGDDSNKFCEPPQKLRFELRPEVKYLENDLTRRSRLNQIPFISLDFDVWYQGGLETPKSGYAMHDRTYRENFKLERHNRALEFKMYMYSEIFNRLCTEIKRQMQESSFLSSDLFWDFISIGDNERDHLALKGIFNSTFGLNVFRQGIRPFIDQELEIQHAEQDDRDRKGYLFTKTLQYSDIGPATSNTLVKYDWKYDWVRKLHESILGLHKTGLKTDMKFSHRHIPSIKSYYNDMKTNVKEKEYMTFNDEDGNEKVAPRFIRHLETMERDLAGHFLDYDESIMLERRQLV